jgi:hypothetical protein
MDRLSPFGVSRSSLIGTWTAYFYGSRDSIRTKVVPVAGALTFSQTWGETSQFRISDGPANRLHG